MTTDYENDPFGNLSFDVLWEGSTNIPALGSEVELEVETSNDAKPSQSQRDLYLSFVAACDTELVATMIRLLVTHFAALGHVVDEVTLVQELSDPSVYIPPAEAGAFIAVQWECDIDEEHGVQVIWREDGSLISGAIGEDS